MRIRPRRDTQRNPDQPGVKSNVDLIIVEVGTSRKDRRQAADFMRRRILDVSALLLAGIMLLKRIAL